MTASGAGERFPCPTDANGERYEGESKMQMSQSTESREEYIFIDICRVICALLVFSCHMPPFADYSDGLSFWLEQIAFRIVVPFFFLTSGYFLANKVGDWQKVKGYFMKLLRLYLVYTVLYFPQIIYEFKKTGTGAGAFALSFLQNFFLAGSYTHLWYFQALLVAVPMVYFFKNKTRLSNKAILGIGLALYAIGCAGCTYRSITVQNAFLHAELAAYERIFVTTRNGVFFGFFFVFFGYCIRMYGKCIPEKYYPALAAVFFALMHVEAYILRYRWNIDSGFDMLYTIPLAAAAIFLLASSVRIPVRYEEAGKYLRKLSLLMFGLHLFVRFYLHWILLHVAHITLGSLPYYLLMSSATVALSCLIIWLENKKGFRFLKLLT